MLLDPTGSQKGKTLSDEELAGMTEEQQKHYEADQMMRGLGNKCLKKLLESLVLAAAMMVLMYYTGAIDQFLIYFNPEIAKRMATEKALP